MDDIPDNTYILKELLGRYDVRVVTSNEGSKALEIFRKEGKFDAIITDLRMPGMSGQSFISNIRLMEKESRDKPVPIVIVTAENEQSEKINCLQKLEANDYLLKPIKLHDLLLSLSKIFTGEKKETKNILVIEDEPISASIISKILSEEGHLITISQDISKVILLNKNIGQNNNFQRAR